MAAPRGADAPCRVTAAGAETTPAPLRRSGQQIGLPETFTLAIASARLNYALGDYETASFAAMKAIEVDVEVRRVAGLLVYRTSLSVSR